MEVRGRLILVVAPALAIGLLFGDSANQDGGGRRAAGGIA
jgi:hypothetical protein